MYAGNAVACNLYDVSSVTFVPIETDKRSVPVDLYQNLVT